MIMNGKYKKIWKVVVMTYFTVLSQDYLGSLRGNHGQYQLGYSIICPRFEVDMS
jgi:hypothetical protein